MRITKVASILFLIHVLAGDTVGTADAPAEKTKTVVAGEQYGKPPGGLFFFGKDYRDLWTAPVQIPVLDMQSFAGGLKPVMRIGGNSTKGLALKGADGRDYTFRSVNKDLSRTVPVEFQDSVLVEIVQDQIAGNVPGVEVIKPPLAKAVGVLTVDQVSLVVLPDDSALGQFREDFAGVFGTFYEFPQPRSESNPGFRGATEILSADAFWKARQASAEVAHDSRPFLRARLLDIFLNDYDRHRKQWRWARIPGQPLLQPVPEDADMALTDYEGAALGVARFMGAPYVKFEDDYPPLRYVTKNGWDWDRLLLTDIEKPEWMRIAADMQAKLTDAVLDEAVRQMPAKYQELRGGEILPILKSRRDQLTQYAERYYRYMAGEVDIHGSDSAEIANLDWLDDGGLRVTVSRLDAGRAAGEPFYRRRFTPDETKEVRIYLHGGEDEVATSGSRKRGLKIRVIGGAGNDLVKDNSGSAIRFYDNEGQNRVEGASGIHLDSREFAMPSRPDPNDVSWVPNPDWGRVTTPIVALGYSRDPGLMLGAGFDTKGRGFRKYPWATSHTFQGSWAFGASKPFVDYTGAMRLENSNVQFELNTRFSGIEQLRFYGLGNETEFDQSTGEIYDISDYQTEVFPAMVVSSGPKARFAIGPYLQYSDSGGTDPDSVLGRQQPFGFGKFGHVGLRSEASFDSRTGNDVFAPGVEVRGTGKYNFRTWDARTAFGSVDARFGAHLMTGNRLAWTLSGGGKKVWGDYPFFEAAYLDQRTTIGYGWNRFGGDASVYGGVNLDIVVAKMRNMVPGDFGFSLFSNAGRVYFEGEDSGKWHPSYGAGIFYAPFQRTSLYGLKVGVDDDRVFIVIEARMAGFGL